MWYKSMDTSFFSFVTVHAFDRETDRQTDGFLFAIPCVPLRTVKAYNKRKFYFIAVLQLCAWLYSGVDLSQ